MSVTEHNIVDSIAVDGSRLILLISDHLSWDEEYDHLLELQAKLNAYILFCEREQYRNVYPDAQIRSATIEIHFLYEPTSTAIEFLSQVQLQLCADGITIECHMS